MPRGLESCNVCARLFSVLVGGLCAGCIESRARITKDKICSRCSVVRPVEDFYKRTDGSIMATCKPCFLEDDRRRKQRRATEKAEAEKKEAKAESGKVLEVWPLGPTAEEIRAAKNEARTAAARARIEAAKVADSRPRLKKGGRPRKRHLEDPMHECSMCRETLPAEMFNVNVRLGVVHPNCNACSRARQRDRDAQKKIVMVLGRLLLWRMAYDPAFGKNFLAGIDEEMFPVVH